MINIDWQLTPLDLRLQTLERMAVEAEGTPREFEAKHLADWFRDRYTALQAARTHNNFPIAWH